MNQSQQSQVNKPYIIGVSLLTFVLPLLASGIQQFINTSPFSVGELGKWFLFFASGWRLFLAGLRQISKPAFTAKAIFHLEGTESYPVIRELGFANLCTGLIALIALFIPAWRQVSFFGSGLYYGLAGLMHAVKKPAGINEKFALYTDLVIFALLMLFFFNTLNLS